MKRAQNSHSKTQIRLLEEIKAVHANSHLFGHPVFKCMVNQLQLGVCVIVAYLKQRQPYWQAWQTVLIVSARNAKRPIEKHELFISSVRSSLHYDVPL